MFLYIQKACYTCSQSVSENSVANNLCKLKCLFSQVGICTVCHSYSAVKCHFIGSIWSVAVYFVSCYFCIRGQNSTHFSSVECSMHLKNSFEFFSCLAMVHLVLMYLSSPFDIILIGNNFCISPLITFFL